MLRALCRASGKNSLELRFRPWLTPCLCWLWAAAASTAAFFREEKPFFLTDGEGDSMPLEKVRTESSRDAFEAPRERGRGTARCHGPGESFITSGDGSGVRSPSAFSAGDEKAEAGDSDPMLAVDQADRK